MAGDATLVTQAWQEAVQSRRPPPGLLHPSDRGSQYASGAMTALLAASVSRRGNGDDNAPMERFWATLKAECFGAERPATRQAAPRLIFGYVEGCYNRPRLPRSLGSQSALAFDQKISDSKN